MFASVDPVIVEGVWQHVLVVFDSRSPTTRPEWGRMWVNGVEIAVQITFQSGSQTQNMSSALMRTDISQRVGVPAGGNFFNGKIADLCCIDFDSDFFADPSPAPFGEFIGACWSPRENPLDFVSVGNGGFFLRFNNDANLGEDSSPSAWPGANAGTVTQSADTPAQCNPEPVDILNSMWLDDNPNSAKLYRGPNGSATTKRQFTLSCWVKRSTFSGATQIIFSAGLAVGTLEYFGFDSADKLRWHNGNTGTGYFISDAVFRDTSRWMHIVLAVDTDQAVQADRAKVYVDGELLTGTQATTLGWDTQLTNDNRWRTVGNGTDSGGGQVNVPLRGLMSDFHFVMEQQLEPTEFAQDKGGVWTPVAYAGGYPVNSFYLKFENAAELGEDSSGAGYNWIENAGVNDDNQSFDTPTNNCCVMDAVFGGGAGWDLLKGGTWPAPASSAGTGQMRGTFPIPATGKWYFEFDTNSRAGDAVMMYGLTRSDVTPDWFSRYAGRAVQLLLQRQQVRWQRQFRLWGVLHHGRHHRLYG